MKVIMGFSYKGGAGRSVGLAHVAAALALSGQRVLIIDFDMEAPGLHVVLRRESGDSAESGKPPLGLPDYLIGDTVKSPSEVLARRLNVEHVKSDTGHLHLLTGVAYRPGGNYGTSQVFMRLRTLMEYLKQADEYDFVCIDSPSGIHAISEHVFSVSQLILLFFRWSLQHVEGTRITMEYLNDCIEGGVLEPRTYEIVASSVPTLASVDAEGDAQLSKEVEAYLFFQRDKLRRLLKERNDREKKYYGDENSSFHAYVDRTWIEDVEYEAQEYTRMKFKEGLTLPLQAGSAYERIAHDLISGRLTTPSWMGPNWMAS